MTPKEVLDFAKKNKVEMVDLKFVDLVGTWQHFSIPTSELSLDLFKEGSGFDGSSIRGWKMIQNSDMLIVPRCEYRSDGSVHRNSHIKHDFRCPRSYYPHDL